MNSKNVLLSLSLVLFSMVAKAQTTYYVKSTVTASGAGTSWPSAYKTLQEALTTATSGDQIWVAAGTYYPDEGGAFADNDRTACFSMKEGVKIYGGFEGNETLFSNRNWKTNLTILSGDIDKNDGVDFSNTANNTFRIIVNNNNGLTAAAVLDGFTISDGNANDSNNGFKGGGIDNTNVSPSIVNCSFLRNKSNFGGGGLYNTDSTPTIINCIFSGNSAPTGGAIRNYNSDATIINCVFSGNNASNIGGGVYISESSPTLINCTFSGNKASSAGAIYVFSFSTASFKNCIFWGNSSEVGINSNSSGTYSHCLIQGADLTTIGTGNLDGTNDANNPNFISPLSFTSAPATAGNLRLSFCSPVRNLGKDDDNSSLTDPDGNPRKIGTIDLGAYESQSSASTQILYVKTGGDDTKDGLSWANSFKTLQKALQQACTGTQIWVAAGTYYPDEGGSFSNNDRNASFVMKNGVAIYGGFLGNGTETLLSHRIWKTNVTTLSGDIDQNDGSNFANNNGNSYHVIYNNGNGLNTTAILDGFSISGGNTNKIDGSDNNGGGMFNISTNPTITNCTFVGNFANLYGGGMCNQNANPNVTNCSFVGNKANEGAGMGNLQSSPNVTNCAFRGNVGYTATGMYNLASNPILTNCSFSGNIAGVSNNGSNPILKNCILWGNPGEISNTNNGTPTYINTIVRGLNLGSGVFDGTRDPLFVLQPTYSNVASTIGDLRLQACSPALNQGNNAENSTTTDLDGNSRKIGTIDLGAYEYQGSTATILYVKTGGDDTKDGQSWANAYKTLQKALQQACAGTQIWVAAGTYKPGTNRTDAFAMKNGVAIYGGFPNSGSPTLTERNWVSNVTILSGDINDDDVVSGSGSTLSITGNGENCYHVIFNDRNGLTATAILDGFTIKGGNANGNFVNPSGSDNIYGGGMYNYASSPTVTHCTFSGNAAEYGAGMTNQTDGPNRPIPTVTNCIFLGNLANFGGGMYNEASTPTVTNCTFLGNKAIFEGGGMRNFSSSRTIAKNCIFWGNTTQIQNSSSQSTVYSYCLVQGGYSAGTNIINQDPLFMDAANGNLRLKSCSPAINAGENTGISGTDLDNNSRIYNNGTVDLGAYEYQAAPPAVIMPTVGSTGPSTCGGTNGSITLSGFLANIGYSVTYTKGATNVPAANFTANANGVITLANLSAGDYTNIVATYGTCVSTAANATLSDPVPPTATIGVTNSPICVGGNASFNVNGTNGATLTYTLTGVMVNQTVLLNGSNQTITANNVNANVTLTLVSVTKNNCNANLSAMATVTVTPLPTANISYTGSPFCKTLTTAAVTLTGTNAYTGGSFSSTAGLSINPTTGEITPSASTAGTYNVTYTIAGAGGCAQVQANTSVTITALPTANITYTGSPFCKTLPTAAVTLTGTNAYTGGNYSSTTGLSINPTTGEITPSASTAGTYLVTYTITTAGGCAQVQATTSLTINALPTATISGTVEVCKDATPPDITFTGSNGTAPYTFTYKINNGNNLTAITTNGNSVTHSQTTAAAGAFTYTLVSVSDNNNCAQAQTGSATITVLAPQIPTSPTGGTISVGQSISLTANGCLGEGFTLLWYKSVDNTQVTMPVSPTVTTSYYARCQQSSGQANCLSAKTVDVTVVVGQRFFVNTANVNPSQDGTTWTKAFTSLQAALTVAGNSVYSPVEVWVAQGTYTPGVLRRDAFVIPSGVKVYGGFVGSEDSLHKRNWKTRVTTLSGEIGTVNKNDNTQHVVLFSATNDSTRLDGFTIRGGYAEFFAGTQNTNLTDPDVLTSGGGVLAINKSKGIITHCTLTDNRASAGGGIQLRDTSSLHITQSIIWGNEANFGGGIYVLGGSTPSMENVLIVNNKGLGAGLYVNRSQPVVSHCTIASNKDEANSAGGILNANAVTTVKNSILWGNTGLQSNAGSVMSYSLVEGGYSGTGNKNQDPLFISANSVGLAPMGSLGDYHLQPCSPAINGADNTWAPPVDLEGNPRPFPSGIGIADMGVYESQTTGTSGPNHLDVAENITSGTVLKTGSWITATNQVSNAVVIYQATKSVTLQPGFSATANDGKSFQATIGGCL